MSLPSRAKPRTDAEPAAARSFARIDSATAAEILKRYEPGERAAALAGSDTSPRRFLDKLLAAQLHEDAVSFLAYALPRREGLWWGLRCVRDATPKPVPAQAAAIASADAWIRDPGDDRRREAMTAAEAATYATPAGCLALAVFFSEGSMAPRDCPPIPVGEWFCARTLAAAVHLSCLAHGQDAAAAAAQRYVKIGMEVADGPAPWDPKA